MGFLASFLVSFISGLICTVLIYWLDRFEKEPKILVGFVFLWGAIVAAVIAFLVNTILGIGIFLVTGSEVATEFTTGSLVAPFIEESLKGIAAVGVFFFFRQEFDSILDGIIYAAVAALGFAATENTYYIYNYGFLEQGWSGFWGMIFIRVFVVAWQHPFYTAFIGIGFAISRLNRNRAVQIGAPFLGWLAAILFHSIHNTIASIGSELFCIVGSIMDWSGWLAMLAFIIIMIFRERKLMVTFLASEVQYGSITNNQYQAAITIWRQFEQRLTSLVSGKFRQTARFFQLCGEIAHKKNQIEKVGEEGKNLLLVEQYRNELARLSPNLGF